MKRYSFFFVLALIAISFGLANGQGVTLDATSGTWDDGGTMKIVPGAPVTFDFGMDNSAGVKEGGFGMGFQIWTDAGGFTPATIDTNAISAPGWKDMFTFQFAIFHHNVDGAGRDTVGILAAAFPSDPGLAAGRVITNGVVVGTGGVDVGATLCIDSSFVPSSTFWKWGSGLIPAWEGPYCYLAETPPCLPPTFDNGVTSLGGSHCDLLAYDFDATANPNDGSGSFDMVFSADLGTIDPGTGAWSYQPTLADVGASNVANITVSNNICETVIAVTLNFTNEAPVIACPGTMSVSTSGAATAFITATDDCDGLAYSIASFDVLLTGTTIDANTGELTVVATGAGTALPLVIEVTDGNASSSCTIAVTAVAGSIYQVEIPCLGEQDPENQDGFVFQGQYVDVPVMYSGPVIGGFDFLVAYDNSALSFQYAEAGAAVAACGWEYFTYRYGADGNCGNACPSGLLRLVAIAETNNGPNHPPLGCDVSGELATMTFLVSNDRTLECSSIPIRFFWMDCGDNTLSNWDGDSLLISETVYDGDETLFPPFGDEIQNFDYGYPTWFGAQNEDCDTEEPKAAYRMVSFNNGCVFVACKDSIDDRGDINLNNIPNEIADAVLYSNYFIYGIGAFDINTEGQIAASDVNADGLTLSVADLVYLVRIIVGDALPYPKLAPVAATISDDNGSLYVDGDMGAALVIYKGDVTPTLIADGMDMIFAYDETTNSTRTLVWSADGAVFTGNFVSANAEVLSIELGTADGAEVSSKLIPANFGLAQNYPNPFNPTTTIAFDIPVASKATLTIYNITGQKVMEITNMYEAGPASIEWDASNQASGIYFYKLNAGSFEATKKMVLLK